MTQPTAQKNKTHKCKNHWFNPWTTDCNNLLQTPWTALWSNIYTHFVTHHVQHSYIPSKKRTEKPSNNHSPKSREIPTAFFWCLGVLCALFFLIPENVWAAVTLEEKIDKVGEFFTKKVFKIAVTISTIIGVMVAAVKHSFGAAMSVLVIAVMLCFFLGWLHGDADPLRSIFK